MSILRYPGGKTRKNVREKILTKAPLSYDEYRESCCGGCGIFFATPSSKKRWINDVDNYLMEVYLALRDRPDEFIAKCREIEPGKKEESVPPPIYNHRLKEQFSFFAKNTTCDQALRYFFVNRTVWAGRVNYEIESRMYFSNPSGWNIVRTNKLEKAAESLKNTIITSESYERLLLEPSSNRVWVYCDPPYYVNTKLSPNSKLYRHNFTKEDHIKLSEIVKQSPHMVCVSYDDDDEGFIRSLYDGFNIHTETWTYCGSSSAPDQLVKTKKKGMELIIANY